MQAPLRVGPFSMAFHLGSVPVVIQPTFWLMGILLGLPLAPHLLVVWVGIVLVSILVHELGHALAYRTFGSGTAIELYAFGGLTYGDRVLPRGRSILVSVAGPMAGFLLGGIAWGVELAFPALLVREPWGFLITTTRWVNLWWGVLNLMPVLPLDGGHVLRNVLGPGRLRVSFAVASVAAFLIAGFGIRIEDRYLAVFFLLLALQNLQNWSRLRPRPAVEAPRPEASTRAASPRPEGDPIAEGWAALRQGREQEALRLGTLWLDHARNDEECASALDLLAWAALAGGRAAHAVGYLRRITPPERARALSWALALEAYDRPQEALPWALKAVDQEPSDSSAALAARLLMQTGELDRAEALVQRNGWRQEALREGLLGEISLARERTGS